MQVGMGYYVMVGGLDFGQHMATCIPVLPKLSGVFKVNYVAMVIFLYDS